MYHNIAATDVTDALPRLLRLVLNGDKSPSRNGQVSRQRMVGVTLTRPTVAKEIVTHYRKVNIAAQVAETMWVLAGRNDLAFLSNYLPRAIDYSDDGRTWRAAYGRRMRNWTTVRPEPGNHVYQTVDQWRAALEELAANPETRRAVISLWDPAVDTTPGKDLPCNDWLSFSADDGILDLHVGVRSNDVMWGWSGINQFEWASLLEISAALVHMTPGALHFSITDLHLYEPHWERTRKIIRPTGYANVHLDLAPSPAFDGRGVKGLSGFDDLVKRWFEIEHGIRNDHIANTAMDVEEFPEPMLQSWLRVLQWHWTGDAAYLRPLVGTRLFRACEVALQPPAGGARPLVPPASPQASEEAVTKPREFIDYVTALHDEKHAAYGNSWKRRGEMLGIMANLARKVDRLGKTGGGDTRTDTAVDLLVYLCKYHGFLLGLDTDTTVEANALMRTLADAKYDDDMFEVATFHDLEMHLTQEFTNLEHYVNVGNEAKKPVQVIKMAGLAYVLASRLWYESDYRGADHD